MSSMKADYRVGVGASSVLMILVALAMAALGLLAFGSARMTETLTRRNVDVSAAYYEAAAKVQEKLCEIDGAALAYRRLGGGSPLDAAWFEARGPEGVEWTAVHGELYFMYETDAGEDRVLTARGRMLTQGGARYELLEHTLAGTRCESGETDLILMGE